ncbi:SMI1/KNR4 family protein [Streptomyces sp. NPDC001904]|uniref:SMI1/KNR4 family protein n=1 Tax=Streptomyces sp. NPDC001904 TaxID=3154531 RepID=UPI00333244B7
MDDQEARVREIERRQIDDAWRRIEAWLQLRAPATFGNLLPGASEADLAELQESLGVRLPVGLKAVWGRSAGFGPDWPPGFMPGGSVLLSFEMIRRVYEERMILLRRHEEAQKRKGAVEDEIPLWRASWIPFAGLDSDAVSGFCLDAESGKIWSYNETREREVQFESLMDLVEEMADVLDIPSLASEVKVGLMNGFLVWGVPQDPGERAAWVALSR